MHRTLKTNGGDLQRLLPIQRALTEIQHDVKEAREAVESVVDSDSALNAVPSAAPGILVCVQPSVPPAAAGSSLEYILGWLPPSCAVLHVLLKLFMMAGLCAMALALVKASDHGSEKGAAVAQVCLSEAASEPQWVGGRATLMRRSPHMRLAVRAQTLPIPPSGSMRSLWLFCCTPVSTPRYSACVLYCDVFRASQAALLESYERQIQSVEGALRVRKAGCIPHTARSNTEAARNSKTCACSVATMSCCSLFRTCTLLLKEDGLAS